MPLILTVFAKLVRSLVLYMLPAFTVLFVIKLLASWEKKPKNANIKVIKALLLHVQALCKSIQSNPYEAASLEEMEGDRQMDRNLDKVTMPCSLAGKSQTNVGTQNKKEKSRNNLKNIHCKRTIQTRIKKTNLRLVGLKYILPSS